MTRTIQYYHSFQDEIITSANQAATLPDSYIWERRDMTYRLSERVCYPVAREIGRLIWHARYHARIVHSEILQPYQHCAYFLYGNHTQPDGDPLLPMLIARHQRIHTLASPANLGVPVIGRLLQFGDAVLLPQTRQQMPSFLAGVAHIIQAGQPIAIYPERHVWPYYTGIRPFDSSSFHYPVAERAPSFSFTTTYQHDGCTIYLDGPFFPKAGLSKKQQKIDLQDKIKKAMTARARLSTYEHLDYRRIPS